MSAREAGDAVAGSESQRLMLKVCHQAYRRHLSHKEIAANLGISRFQVARLLRAALDAGYVSVNILEPERWHSGLETELEERLGLDAVIIVDGEEVDESELRSRVADAAGRFLLEQALDGAVIGISLGETMQRLVAQLPARVPGKAEVVQLIGGRGRASAEVSSITLAIDLARRFGTEPHLLFAPAVVDSAQREALLAHDDLRATFDTFARLDIAVLGIGSLTEATTSRLRYGGVIDDETHRALLRRGAVADVLSYVLTDDGTVLSSGLEDRTISIGLDDLRRTPHRIGVASGWRKSRAVRAAIASGLVNTLVTDSQIASAIISGER
jgi:DNA-binding transcriptional regulator LsrR (DeoR family)